MKTTRFFEKLVTIIVLLYAQNILSQSPVMVKDINSGSGHSYPASLTVVDGVLYFSANDGSNGFELWKSDGSESGTIRLTDINTGSDHSDIGNLVYMNGYLYFSANDGTNGKELWKYSLQPPSVLARIKVWFEGGYSGGSMSTNLNSGGHTTVP